MENLVFEHDINYKLHQISSQLLIKTNLDQEIEKWAKEKFVLKGNSGKLKIKIKQEKIFDNFFCYPLGLKKLTAFASFLVR